MSDVKCQIIILARFHWRKHEQTRFRSITLCIRKRYHKNPLAETCVSLRKLTEKWSGSVVSAAMETWINDMYPLPETHVSRCVSAMLSCVSATFQSADSWHFVLCTNSEFRRNSKLKKALWYMASTNQTILWGRTIISTKHRAKKNLGYIN